MFSIRIAELVIRIDNRYAFTRARCSDYIVPDDLEAAFTVSADDSEILEAFPIVFTPEERAEPETPLYEKQIGYCEWQVIHRQICRRIIQYDAVMLHAAVIAFDGGAYAFSADSGTGKSTHIRLWQSEFGDRVQVINGDKPMLRLIDGKVYAFGTPWCGKEGLNTNMCAPLRAICFLERGETNSIVRIPTIEVYRRIFDQLQRVYDVYDEATMDRFYTLTEKIIGSAQHYLLRCNMEPEAAHVAMRGMMARTE